MYLKFKKIFSYLHVFIYVCGVVIVNVFGYIICDMVNEENRPVSIGELIFLSLSLLMLIYNIL
jgi:hypothetical protein